MGIVVDYVENAHILRSWDELKKFFEFFKKRLDKEEVMW